VGLRINNNLEAFNAHRQLVMNSLKLAKSMERLSSGYRINSAADDAAGLGISERMRAQIGGIAQAQRNAQDGISMVQTAEGSLQEMHSILGRIRDLAVQYNNGIYDAAGQNAITGEVAQLSAELDRMIGSASFNGFQLLQTPGALATLQVGPNGGDTMSVNGCDAATSLGTEISNFATLSGPGGTVNVQAIDDAIANIARDRSGFGAVQNRLEHTINSLGVYQENLQSAESRIRDVDMAQEMTELTRLQILQQSGTAMLGQANMLHSSVLSLLQ
jgi:flagellin